MDEGKDRVNDRDAQPAKEDPQKRVDQLEQRAEAIRDNLDGLVGELDHRRHEVARRYVKPIAISVAVLAAGAIGFAIWWRRRHRLGRMERLAVAVRRAIAHPDRVAKSTPSMLKKLATAAGTAGASVAARRLVSRVLPDR